MSKREPRIAVIHPRLDGHGGLEKYGVHVIDVLSRRFPVDVLSEHEVDLGKVERAFGVRLQGPRFLCDPRCNPEVKPEAGRSGRQQAARDYAAVTAPYDFIVGQTVGLPNRSAAKRSALLCHFPVVRGLFVDPSVPHKGPLSLLSSAGRAQRDIRGRIDSWTRIIANSQFTSGWVKRYWHRETTVINPPIALPEAPALSQKRNWILGIGFFGKPPGREDDPWSYKRQELLIQEFKALCNAGLTGWELHLAGHVLPPTPDVFAYVEEMRRSTEGYPIHLHPNCPYEELQSLYRHGSLLWHATGYGMDPEREPERMEHFGMVTAEAMGWGVVPVVVNMGGQPEIVQDGENGFLWNTLDELRARTLALTGNPAQLASLRNAAVERAQHFDLNRFERQLNALVDEELAALR